MYFKNSRISEKQNPALSVYSTSINNFNIYIYIYIERERERERQKLKINSGDLVWLLYIYIYIKCKTEVFLPFFFCWLPHNLTHHLLNPHNLTHHYYYFTNFLGLFYVYFIPDFCFNFAWLLFVAPSTSSPLIFPLFLTTNSLPLQLLLLKNHPQQNPKSPSTPPQWSQTHGPSKAAAT